MICQTIEQIRSYPITQYQYISTFYCHSSCTPQSQWRITSQLEPNYLVSHLSQCYLSQLERESHILSQFTAGIKSIEWIKAKYPCTS